MKLGFLADCHLGNPKTLGGDMVAGVNRRGLLVIDTFERAVRELHDSDHLILLGDVFDSDVATPTIIAHAQTAMRNRNPSISHAIVGNHDATSPEDKHNACAPLAPICSVYETAVVRSFLVDNEKVEVLFVPFQPGPASEWLPSVVSKMKTSPLASSRVLCVHLGVEDSDSLVHIQGADDSIHHQQLFEIMRDNNIDATFAGNWHEHKTWTDDEHLIVQVGTTCPTGFNNLGFEDYGYAVSYDTVEHEFTVLEIGGPRFVKLDDLAPRAHPAVNPRGNGLVEWLDEQGCPDDDTPIYLHVDTRPSRAPAWSEALLAYKGKGIIQDGKRRIDRKLLNEVAEDTAEEVAQARTPDEAVAVYVEEMTVPKGVKRAEVKAIVTKALI